MYIDSRGAAVDLFSELDMEGTLFAVGAAAAFSASVLSQSCALSKKACY